MIEILLSALVLIFGVLAVRSKDLIYAVVFLGGISITITLLFLYLQAPDLAMTKAAVAGVSTVIYIIAIKKTERLEK
jgi:uncharacterized MnhB-related membrane protein